MSAKFPRGGGGGGGGSRTFFSSKSIRSACAYAQSDQSLCLSLKYSMTVKLLTEHHLEFLSFKGGCRGLSEYTCQNATLFETT